MKDIFISVTIPTRDRARLLLKCVKSAQLLALFPNNIEYLILIDEEDNKTLSFIEKEKYFKEIKNLRIFTCPRIGYGYHYIMMEHLMRETRGEIIVPIADDCIMTLKNWDENFLRYRDEVKIFYHDKIDIAFTRNAYNKYENIRRWFGSTRNTDVWIRKLGISEGCGARMGKWYKIDKVKHVDRFDSKSLSKMELDNFQIKERI